MTVETIQFKRNNSIVTDRNPSPNIWSDCPWLAIEKGVIDGTVLYDDFDDFLLPGTQTTEISLGRYKVYNTGAGVWQTDAMPHSTTPGQAGGIISNLCDTDGDAAAIGTQASPFLLTTTQQGKLWFEARVATTSILTDTGQWFVGLCENAVITYGAATPLANADATASGAAMIGFNRLEDGLNVLNFSYADHAAAWTNIQASCNTTLAANTWIKLGFKIDFTGSSSRYVRAFVDNVECTSAMTKAALLALTHLDVKGLGPCMAFFADSGGTADYTYLDWWRVAQTF